MIALFIAFESENKTHAHGERFKKGKKQTTIIPHCTNNN